MSAAEDRERSPRGPRSLAGRVTLAAVVAVGAALAVGGVAVVVAAARADRSALDRELVALAERLDRPGVRMLRPGDGVGAGQAGTVITGSSYAGKDTRRRRCGERGRRRRRWQG